MVDQKKKYLPRITSGESLACYALTEPNAGSDAMNGESTAYLNAVSSNQGEPVGVAMVAPGLGFAIGPLMSGFLYEISPNLPYLICIPIFVVVFLLVLYIKRYI